VILFLGNSLSYCQPQEKTEIQQAGFNDYQHLSLVFIVIIIFVSSVMALVSFAYDKYKNTHNPASFRTSAKKRDEIYQIAQIGKGSVYQFFAGHSVCGWCIVLITVGAQFWLLSIFVKGSEINLSDDKVDVVYTWKCTRDNEICDDMDNLEWNGWVGFAVLVGVHLLTDVINGGRMIVLSAKERHSLNDRVRFFIGGATLITISLFTFFVSTIYNIAIATSKYYMTDEKNAWRHCISIVLTRIYCVTYLGNTEVLVNSVLILVITHIDELVLGVLTTISPTWVESMVRVKPKGQTFEESPLVEQPQSPNDKHDVMTVQHLQRSLYELTDEVHRLIKKVKLLEEHCLDQQDGEACGTI